MHPEHGFLLLFLAIAGFLFVRAYHEGVESMLWSSAAVVAGLIGGGIFYRLLPGLLPDWEAGFRTRVLLTFLVALIPYLVVRFVAKRTLTAWFEPKGIFGGFSDGLWGGLLSLVPALLTIVILIFCIRIGGTWADLRRYEKVSIPGADLLERDYPRRPLLAKWRDGVEQLPFVVSGFGVVDRVNRIPERNLVGLLITTKKEELYEHLSEDPESKLVFETLSFLRLLQDPEVKQLNVDRQHFALLKHVAVRATARDPAIREKLRELELHRLVDEFMLSPDRQSILESYQRRD